MKKCYMFMLHHRLYSNIQTKIPVQLKQEIEKLNMEKIFSAIYYISLCCWNSIQIEKFVPHIILNLAATHAVIHFAQYKKEYNVAIILFCIKLHEILIANIIEPAGKIEKLFPNTINYNPDIRKIMTEKIEQYNQFQNKNQKYISLLQNITFINSDHSFYIIKTHCKLLEERYNFIKIVDSENMLIKYHIKIYKILEIMLHECKLNMNILHQSYKAIVPHISSHSILHLYNIFIDNKDNISILSMYTALKVFLFAVFSLFLAFVFALIIQYTIDCSGSAMMLLFIFFLIVILFIFGIIVKKYEDYIIEKHTKIYNNYDK